MASSVGKGGTRGTLFAALARTRLDDAKCLVKNGRIDGAVYLLGYAIECCLKQAVCIQTGATHLPNGDETHSWDHLVEAANLWPAIREERKMQALYSSLAETWRKHGWGPGMRYRLQLFSKQEGQQLYSEVKELYQSLIEKIQ